MKPAPIPSDEACRLEALYQLGLLDTASDERFDGITRLAQHCLEVPIAIVSLVDQERQWFKSIQGLSAKETSRDISFCGHAICDASDNGLFIVEDTHEDERFFDNPLVTDGPMIRFYASRVIKARGQAIGTLCVIDTVPRQFSEKQCQQLHDLADQVEHELHTLYTQEKKRTNIEDKNNPSFQISKFKDKLIESFCNRTSAGVIASLMFLSMLFLGYHWHLLQLTELKQHQLNQASALASTLRGTIETELNTRLYLTKGLAGLVHSNNNVTEEEFLKFAESLGDQREGIRSLQLAPQGIVTHVWPLETNRGAIGHNLLSDPERRKAANLAISAERIWLAGPVNLIQGGRALIGRLPIFTENRSDIDAPPQETFWGFGTILIDLDNFFEITGLNDPAIQEIVTIRGKDAEGRQGDIFFGAEKTQANQIVTTDVTLPAGSWEIGVFPGPEITHWKGQELFWLGIIIAATLLSLATYTLLRLPKKFRATVEQTTNALHNQETLFRDAVEALPDGFLIFDATDRLVTFNERIKSLFATSKKVIVEGNSYEHILRHGCELGQFKNYQQGSENIDYFIDRRMKNRQHGYLTIEEPLDSGKWVRIVERPIRGGGTVCFVVDITKLKYNEAELADSRDKAQAANDAKSNFLATVSHEIRTPMNVVLGLLETIADSQKIPKKQLNLLQTAHQSAKQLLHILNEILDISKMESNKLQLEPEPFRLTAAVNNVIQLAQPMALEKGLTIELNAQVTEQEEYWMGDHKRIQQILFNLLSNSVKFTEQGSISVTLSKTNEMNGIGNWLFSVSDMGIGFNSADADKLFEPFSQLDSGAQRAHEGTGLGLAICKQLVELMGGQISATSAPGKGATFQFSLPLTRASKEPGAHATSDSNTTHTIQLEQLYILLAEDSPANQIVFKAMLESAGHQIDIVNDGEAAVAACKENQYDVILMDIFMPRMDGVTATQEIRKHALQEQTPIIALTANAMKGDQERYLEAGMDEYLSKPISKNDLLEKLNEQRGRRRAMTNTSDE